ncbi:MAG: glycosyltransferase family 2 protein [Thermodesulfobacteriota bacterium]
MFHDNQLAVVVPAYNEELLIGRVIDTLPDYVDHIVIVDDCSRDRTAEVVREYARRDGRVVLISHEKNQGVGGAIASGYKWARDNKVDVTVVMAGDAQMDPADLPNIVRPVATGEADYTKGNRLFHGEAWKVMPTYRYLGNSFLSLFTKIASGYWHIADSQTGYTAISLDALYLLDLDCIYKRYGMPNDILIRLNTLNMRVRDVPIRPVYNVGEKSGIRLRKVLFTISWLLVKGFFRRMWLKYVIEDFHPLVFFYMMGIVLCPLGLLFGSYLLFYRLFIGGVETTSALFAAFLYISGLQSLFFAMWFDMDYNKKLR